MYILQKYRAYNYYTNEFVCEADTQVELANLLGVAKSTITHAFNRKTLVKDKFRIEISSRDKVAPPPPKKMTKEEKYLDYLYRHLKQFGNTCSNRDPMPYLDKFKEIKPKHSWNIPSIFIVFSVLK